MLPGTSTVDSEFSNDVPFVSRVPWYEVKNQRRSFLIGPPNVPPYWLRSYTGRAVPCCFRKKLFALSESLRRNSYTFPWKAFVPLFVTAATTPPVFRPLVASYKLVCTMNSCSVSVAGTARFGVEPVPIELESIPLITTEFDVVRDPFTLTTASPRPSSEEFCIEPVAP